MQTEKKTRKRFGAETLSRVHSKAAWKSFFTDFQFHVFARNEQSFLVLDSSSAPSRWVKDYTTSIVSDPVFLIV